METMMALGTFRFSIDTAAYQELKRKTEWRWPIQERIGRTPARQFLGRGRDTIKLKGTIFPFYKGGLRQISAIRDEADQGKPLILMSGEGEYMDKWVISGVEETAGVFLGPGLPRKVEFDIELEFYGDDTSVQVTGDF